MSFEHLRYEMETREAADACAGFLNSASLSLIDPYVESVEIDGTVVEVRLKGDAPERLAFYAEHLITGFKYGFRAGSKASAGGGAEGAATAAGAHVPARSIPTCTYCGSDTHTRVLCSLLNEAVRGDR